jgi:hypothetical protein
MLPVPLCLALLVYERVSISLQSHPGPVTSPSRLTQRVRLGSHTPVCISRGRQVPTLGRLREGAVGAAAAAPGSGVHTAADGRRHRLQSSALIIIWCGIFCRCCFLEGDAEHLRPDRCCWVSVRGRRIRLASLSRCRPGHRPSPTLAVNTAPRAKRAGTRASAGPMCVTSVRAAPAIGACDR